MQTRIRSLLKRSLKFYDKPSIHVVGHDVWYTTMSFERLLELLKLGLNRSIEQELEFETLISARRMEQFEAIPRPSCCQAIQKYPVITFVINDEPDSSTADGRWSISLSERFWEMFGDGSIGFFRGMPAPEYCPFCGTPLPRMTRKCPPPSNLCRVSDGGYYCDNCEERLDGCICNPPSSAFEPCIDEPLKTIPTSKPVFEDEDEP